MTQSRTHKLSTTRSLRSFFISLLSIILSVSFSAPSVDAGLLDHYYSIVAPTAATRWVTGQTGLISLSSTDKASAGTSPTDKLLTITLRSGSGVVATIADRLQLLIPNNSTASQVSLDITSWTVPTNVPAGMNYYVQLDVAKAGFFDIPESEQSAKFQIITANTTIPTPTATTATTTTIAPPTATPNSCNDVQEQCAAQGKVFQNATATAPCSCGSPLVVPTIIPSSAIRGMTSSYAALTVLLLGLLALF